MPPELIVPPIPPGCGPLWECFLALNSARESGGMGPSSISLPGIVAWQTLNDVQLNPWEIDTLQALDAVALKSAAEQQKSET